MLGAAPTTQCQKANFIVAQPTAPQALQTLLQAKYGDTVTVANFGVPGTTAANLLGGDGVNLPWAQQMAKSKANIVIVRYGINDSHTPSEPVNVFQSNEDEIVRIAKAAGKIVVLDTASPVIDPTCPQLPNYAAATRQAGYTWGITIVDLYAQLSAMPGWDSMLSDGVHPTATGYQIIAQAEFDALDPVVGFDLAHLSGE